MSKKSPTKLFDNGETVHNGKLAVPVVSQKETFRPGGRDDPFRTYRISKQAMIIGAWVSIGLYAGVIGPTLPDLRDSLGVGTDDISLALAGKSFGFLSGALIGGFLFRIFYKKAELLIFLSISGMASIALAPWGNSLAYVVFFFWTAGTSEGILNVGGNTMVMHLWQEHAATPLLLTHFGFGLGSIIAPQLARPFLSETTNDASNVTTTLPFESHDEQKLSFLQSLQVDQYLDSGSNFEFCYVIVSVFVLLIACGYLYFVIKDPPEGFATWKPEGQAKEMIHPGSCANGHWIYSLSLLAILFIYYFTLGGGQAAFADFLYAFATESDLAFSPEKGSAINSVFWLCYTIGRLGGGIAAHWIPIPIIIPIAIGISAISSITVAIFAMESEVVLWLFTCTFGLFVTMLFPGGMGWSNLYLNMNSMSTMVLLMGFGLGKIPFQYLAGYVFDEFGPEYIFYVSASGMSSMIFIFAAMQIIGACNRNKVFVDDEEQIVIDVKSLSNSHDSFKDTPDIATSTYL